MDGAVPAPTAASAPAPGTRRICVETSDWTPVAGSDTEPSVDGLGVDELVARCHFPEPGTPVVAAVSGGADSLALLVLAAAAGCRVTAVHVDHGLRDGSAAEADVVADAAARVGAAFRAVRAPVSPGPNLEARARDARRGVLPPGASTGHTMDDQAETVLINLLRGAGIDGLAAMEPGPTHPLLDLRRHHTTALCARVGLAPVLDPSNDDPRFVRNRVRHELLPLCCAVAGRDVVPLLARQAALLAGERDVLDELAAQLDPTDTRALATAPLALRRRAVRRWLRGGGGHPPDLASVDRVLAVAAGSARATEVPPGRRIRRSARRLVDGP
jgi:tRNA(Ile)-lysidine synthase